MLEAFYALLKITLEFFFWMMLGRIAVSVLSYGRRTFFTDLFVRGTYPVFWLVRRITPSSVGDQHIPILSIPLMLAVLMLL